VAELTPESLDAATGVVSAVDSSERALPLDAAAGWASLALELPTEVGSDKLRIRGSSVTFFVSAQMCIGQGGKLQVDRTIGQ
jgi:hypothetical protein